ncbi:Retrovirus-related Pol polyprotein from transposon RE1 [Vitis vinifera]|uniref:Retrovirus-related Pol polyprotein from transposon RE1 n=1 Tax=Vitis vinifera TaxID=29760 RepID=A0A438H3J8_VITVI|nr:Retrovirus-related Pol polyprotein from transposon RE1 [Vitis vinifera]
MRPWIVDTGASDHMTGDAAILQNYKPSNGHSSVHIADGSKSKIVGTGSIKLTKDLYLDSVLHVQTWIGKMIGSAELCSGLYLLSCGQFSNQVSQASCVQSQSMSESFNSVSNSKGESMNEHQVWESFLEGVPSFHSESPNPSQFAPTELSTPMPPSVQPPQHTMRRKRQELEHGSQSTCGQYIDSNSSLPEENIDHPIGNYVTYEGYHHLTEHLLLLLMILRFPTQYKGIKISEWKKAVQDEIDALEKNGTWTITDLPVGKRPDPSLIGCQSRLVLATTGHKNAFLNGDWKRSLHGNTTCFEESMAKNQKLKKYLSEEFEVKDLGNLKYFLGMEVARSRKGIVVSQRKYILDILKETGMLGCKPIDTPMDSQKKLGIEKESKPVDRGRYQRLVGRLIYLSHNSARYWLAVSAVSQFMHSPTEEHMEAVYRILRYLKMTPGKGLFFRKTENRDTEVYSDADWAGNIIDRRSHFRILSFVWGNLVTLESKKQSVVARSSAEAEYRALAQGICEGIWIKRVLSELGQTSSSPILMMCDNQAAISIAKNPVHHDRTKHVEIDRHFITEKVTSETVKLNYVPTKHQPQTSSPKLYLGLTSKT